MEESYLEQAQTAASDDSLWNRAPTWRNLTIVASLLTCAALAVQLNSQLATQPSTPTAPPVPAGPTSPTASTESMPAANPNICLIVMRPDPIPRGSGTVFGFLTPQQIHTRIAIDEARLAGTINPAYRDRPRALIRVDGDPDPNHYWASVVPAGMQVNLGDHVYYQTAYRDLSLPCGYIPTIITKDEGRLQQAVPPPSMGLGSP